MKKIIFAMISATMLIACADNGVSAPSEICYDKKLTYSDVTSPEYSQYADEWNEGACVAKYGPDCAQWDANYTITIRECAENVEFH